MPDLRVTVAPVGRIDPVEVEESLARVSKVLNRAVELREAMPLPKSAEDAVRAQYRASAILAEGRTALPRLKVLKLVGGAASSSPVATPHAGSVVYVTDVDLFTPSTDAVIRDLDLPRRAAIVSVRRLREAFYRRKADPAKARSRLAKEILWAVGRLEGLSECRDSACVLAPVQALADLDRKGERYCAACWKRLATGAMRI